MQLKARFQCFGVIQTPSDSVPPMSPRLGTTQKTTAGLNLSLGLLLLTLAVTAPVHAASWLG
jgi:hypothetical protein